MALETMTKILDIQVNYEKAIKGIAEYQRAIKTAKDAQKELDDQLKKGKITETEYTEQSAAIKILINERTEAMRKLTKQVQNQRKAEEETGDSINALRAQLSNLTAEYDNLAKAERESLKGAELRDKIRAVTEEIKNQEYATERYYRNVGNYEQAIRNASQQTSDYLLGFVGGFNPAITMAANFVKGLGGLKNAFKAVADGARIFSKQLLALLANPVVAFLAAIAAAISIVVKGLKSSEENSQRFTIILAPLNRGLELFKEALQKVCGWILSVVEAGAKMMQWLSEMAEALPIVGEHFKAYNERNREAIELAKEKIAITKEERQLTIDVAKNQANIADLQQKAKDKEKYNAKERLAFLQESNKLQEEQLRKEVELAERKLKALQIESKWADNDAETNDELARLEAEVYNKRFAFFQKQKELHEQQNTLRKEILADAKAYRDNEVAAIRDLEDALVGIMQEGAAKQRAEITLQYKREIEELQKKLTEEKKLTAAARDAILKTIEAKKEEERQRLAAVDEQVSSENIARRQREIERELAIVKDGSNAELQLRIEKLQLQRDVELSNKQLTEEEKLSISRYYYGLEEQLYDEYEKSLLEKQSEAAKKEAKLQKDREKAYADVHRALIGFTAQLGEENKGFARLSKMLALAEIAINTGKAISAGVASASATPFPANMAAIASTIATIITNMTSAISTVKSAKFATGGKVTGEGTGTSDSIPAMLSNGEYVINAKSTAMYEPLLAAINGAPQAFADGAMAQQSSATLRAIEVAVSNIRPVVSVKEITDVSNRVQAIENLDKIKLY